MAVLSGVRQNLLVSNQLVGGVELKRVDSAGKRTCVDSAVALFLIEEVRVVTDLRVGDIIVATASVALGEHCSSITVYMILLSQQRAVMSRNRLSVPSDGLALQSLRKKDLGTSHSTEFTEDKWVG